MAHFTDNLKTVFTAMHEMQMRSSDENSVHCLSVRLSNVCIVIKWKKKIFIPYGRSFSLVFQEEEWLVGATPSN